MSNTNPRPYQLMGYVFPIGVVGLCCMSKAEVKKAEANTQEFTPIQWNVRIGDGEIICGDCGITVLQQA